MLFYQSEEGNEVRCFIYDLQQSYVPNYSTRSGDGTLTPQTEVQILLWLVSRTGCQDRDECGALTTTHDLPVMGHGNQVSRRTCLFLGAGKGSIPAAETSRLLKIPTAALSCVCQHTNGLHFQQPARPSC